MTPIAWHGCYDKQLAGLITRESFVHPAKFSLGLIERIYDHCLERGYLRRGDLVGDPFGGVATGGIVAAYRGLRWIGVELEERFVGLAKDNIRLHADRLKQLGFPAPEIVQGDSRNFDEIVVPVAGVVCSPPFTQGYSSGGGINKHGYGPGGRDKVGKRTYQAQGGDRAEGNIETLKEGSVDAVITSPPYADSVNSGQSGIDWKKAGRPERDAPSGSRHGVQGASMHEMNYGQAEGQIGRERAETYWEAMREVYAATHCAVKPGGIIAVVVKDYIKNKQRVPLCDDTARLLEHVGFTVIERIHAMLVSETRHNDLFAGETVSKKSRKSFFRRLCESKGSPEINFEEVSIARKL